MILGSQWVAIIPLLSILVIAGVIHSIALTGQTLLMSVKKYRYLNVHQFTNLVLTVLLIWFLSQKYQLPGAVIGLALARLASLPVIAYGVYQTLKK